MFKNFLIQLLFRLLLGKEDTVHKVQYLFGASSSNHEKRKLKWKKALVRVWKDKDLLDYFFYQSESDKEKVFQGKIDRNISVGARIRTLFLVYSAQMAYLESLKANRSTATDKAEVDAEIKKVSSVYKELVSVVE